MSEIPVRFKRDDASLNLDDERDFYIHQLFEEIGASEAALSMARARKPKCPDCNSTGLSHCSDPINCGGLYWPDEMYRSLEVKLATAESQIRELARALQAAAATIEKLAEQNAMHPEYQAQIAQLQGVHVVIALKLGDAEITIASMLKRQLELTGALSELVRACSGPDDPKIAAALFVAEAILDINREQDRP